MQQPWRTYIVGCCFARYRHSYSISQIKIDLKSPSQFRIEQETKPLQGLAVQLFMMLRLGNYVACAVLIAAGVVVQASAQATSQPTPPQATSPQARPPAGTATPATTPQATPSALAPKPTSPSSTTPQARKSGSHRKKAAAEAEAPPAPPPPPPTLEQSAPTPPQVTYQNGQLTIDAANSTLSQVLRAVQSRTGASIDIPASTANDRVVTRLGPGQPRDVLNALLNGSRFDYVILGIAGDPGAVQRVILTPRQSAGASANTAQNNASAPVTADDEGQLEEPAPDAAENEYQNPDQPPPPPGGLRRPVMPAGQPVDPGAENGGGEQQNGPKSPEQLMQELQQMQEQQQRYQQQLNPANQNPPQ